MEFKVLIENTLELNDNLKAEHGLSFMVYYNNKQYLIDAGTSGACVDNAKCLGVDLKADKTFLSHGHYDHAGGFKRILDMYPKTKIYCGENAMGQQYSEKGGIHYIGIPEKIIERYRDNFVECKEVTAIDDGVYIVPHSTKGLEEIGRKTGMCVKTGTAKVGTEKTGETGETEIPEDIKEFKPDNFCHEISVVFDTPKGLVIFNSCSHGGLVNIAKEVKRSIPDTNIYAYVGGLHMKGMKGETEICIFSDEEIAEICKYIQENIDIVITGHCTGEVSFSKLKEYLGDTLTKLSTGKEYLL